MPSAPGLPSREQTGRVMAIVVDDLRMSLRSTVDVRTMLNRYVDRQLRPGDLVAIIRTAGGAGALQQFTSDRRLLKAATERVRASARVWPPTPSGPWEGDGEGLADRFERDVTLEGSLGALAYVVRGIQALPGRKTVVFVSEGFYLATADNRLNDALPEVDHVIDTANRGGVVMYAIDPQGLVNPGWLISRPSGHGPTQLHRHQYGHGGAVQFVASRALFETQGSLEYLAGQTGGFAVVNHNDLTGGLARIGADTRGYYLIGFDTAIPPGVKMDKDEVGIRVNARTSRCGRAGMGFGPADPDAPPPTPPADPLLSAALSPFTTGTLDVRLAALFGHDTAKGDFVSAFVAVDPAGLTLAETAGGGREGNLTMLVFALDDEGDVVGQRARSSPSGSTPTPTNGPGSRPPLQRPAPVQEGGGYQIRAAILDERSQAIGASAQFVEVPRAATSGSPLGRRPDRGERRREVDDRDVRPWEPLEYQGTLYDGRRRATASRSAPRCCATASWFTRARLRRSPARRGRAGGGADPVPRDADAGRTTSRPGSTRCRSTSSQNHQREESRPVRQWVDFEVVAPTTPTAAARSALDRPPAERVRELAQEARPAPVDPTARRSPTASDPRQVEGAEEPVEHRQVHREVLVDRLRLDAVVPVVERGVANSHAQRAELEAHVGVDKGRLHANEDDVGEERRLGEAEHVDRHVGQAARHRDVHAGAAARPASQSIVSAE